MPSAASKMDSVAVRWNALQGFQFRVLDDAAEAVTASGKGSAGHGQSCAAPLAAMLHPCSKCECVSRRKHPTWVVWTSAIGSTASTAEETADADISQHSSQVEVLFETNYQQYSSKYLKRTSVFWWGLMFVLGFSVLMPVLSAAAALVNGIPGRFDAGFSRAITVSIWMMKTVVFLLCFSALLIMHA